MKRLLTLPLYSIPLLGAASALLLLLAHPMLEWGGLPAGPFHDWFPLAFVALVPLFIVLLTQSAGRSFLALGTFVAVFYGLFVGWVSRFSPFALPGVILGVFLYYAAALFLFRLIHRRWPELSWLTLVLVFTALEYSRSLGFLRFPYGSIAYSQAPFLPFIQIADLGGYLLVSLVLYLFNALLADFAVNYLFAANRSVFIRKPRDRFFNRFTVLALVLLLSVGYGSFRLWFESSTPVASAKVALVQPWFDFNLPWNQANKALVFDKLTMQTRRAALGNPDLVVWPESAIFAYYEPWLAAGYGDAMVYQDFFQRLEKEGSKAYVLTGTLDAKREVSAPAAVVTQTNTAAKGQKTSMMGKVGKVTYYNAALLIAPGGAVVDRYHKHLLVPFAEWFPWGNLFPAVAKLLRNALASDFTPGQVMQVFKHPKISLAPLICYEDCFAEFCRDFINRGAQVLVVLTNDAWSYTRTAQQVHHVFSIFRAVENRRPVLRSTNGGVTALVDAWGRTTDRLTDFTEDVLLAEVQSPGHKTLWGAFGNRWMAGVLGALALLFASGFFRPGLEKIWSKIAFRIKPRVKA